MGSDCKVWNPVYLILKLFVFRAIERLFDFKCYFPAIAPSASSVIHFVDYEKNFMKKIDFLLLTLFFTEVFNDCKFVLCIIFIEGKQTLDPAIALENKKPTPQYV